MLGIIIVGCICLVWTIIVVSLSVYSNIRYGELDVENVLGTIIYFSFFMVRIYDIIFFVVILPLRATVGTNMYVVDNDNYEIYEVSQINFDEDGVYSIVCENGNVVITFEGNNVRFENIIENTETIKVQKMNLTFINDF